jgi:hypothetical protein
MISHPRRSPHALALFLAASVWVGVSPAPAGTLAAESAAAQPAAALPEAAEIFERHVEAIGGWDAVDAMQNRRITGTYTGKPFEYAARLQVWWERDGRFHQRVVEPGGLRYELFANGDRAWVKVLDQEPTPLMGVRRIELLDTSDFLGEANYKARYKSIETLARAKAEGKDVWVVKAVTQAGRPHTLYFSVESGLLVGTRVPASSDSGMRELTVRLLDYEEFGGVLYPTRVVQQFQGDPETNEFRYTKIEINTDDEHDYTVPEAVEQAFVEADRRAAESGEDSDG